jgi:hypothetical protein
MRKLISVLVFVVLLAPCAHPALAQGGDGAWSEVVNPDGSIDWGNLTYQETVTESVNWMPSIPLLGSVPAEYQVYTTASGNTIVIPSAMTYFFMALDPQASGLSDAVGALSGNGLSTNGVATDAAFLAGLLGGNLSISDYPGISNQFVSWNQFFDAVVNGQTNIWSLPGWDTLNFLVDLASISVDDFNLYAVLLLYAPSMCPTAAACPELEDLLDDIDFDPPPVPPNACQEPVVIPGQISRNAVKTAPNYPLVVGQDPGRTGVTVTFSASAAPTIYRYWTLEAERECAPGPDGSGRYNCGGGAGHTVVTGWYCERHEISYPECIASASGALRLTQASRDWIVNELAIRYPGAYVHRPSFAFSGPIACAWSYTAQRVQIEDPGQWQAFVNGQTSGTPVSPARSFGGPAGSFQVWLKETAIIE